MEERKKDYAALLELAQEIVLKYDTPISITVFENGEGWVSDQNGDLFSIGYREPKNKAKFSM